MEGANWAGIAAISVLYAVFLAVGRRASRRIKVGSAAELLVAGRAMPFWMATITMAATWIDGGYLLVALLVQGLVIGLFGSGAMPAAA